MPAWTWRKHPAGAGCGGWHSKTWPALHLDAVGLELVVERLASDAEAFGRFELVTGGGFERLDNDVALDTFEQRVVGVRFLGMFDGLAGCDREVHGVDLSAFA